MKLAVSIKGKIYIKFDSIKNDLKLTKKKPDMVEWDFFR